MTTADHSGARAAGSTVRAAAPPGAGTIYVLAPVHNRRAITERFVRCLAAQTDQGFHLVLVDDGSKDGTADAVSSIIPSATILRGTGHWWWAGSLEQARRWLLQQPTGPDDLVLIANDDTTFGPEFLAAARAAMASAPRSLLLARPISGQSGQPGALGATVNWRKLQFKPALAPEDVDVFPTRGLFLRLRDFIDLGGDYTLYDHRNQAVGRLDGKVFSIGGKWKGKVLREHADARLLMVLKLFCGMLIFNPDCRRHMRRLARDVRAGRYVPKIEKQEADLYMNPRRVR